MQETKFVDVCTVTDEPTMYVSQHIEEVNQLKTKIMYLEDSIKHYEQLFTNEKPAALPYIEPQQQYTQTLQNIKDIYVDYNNIYTVVNDADTCQDVILNVTNSTSLAYNQYELKQSKNQQYCKIQKVIPCTLNNLKTSDVKTTYISEEYNNYNVYSTEGLYKLIHDNNLKISHEYNTIVYDIETYALNSSLPDVNNETSNISVVQFLDMAINTLHVFMLLKFKDIIKLCDIVE